MSIALVIIDLQRGIVARDTKPHASADVVRRSAQLADAFRKARQPVVLVHVAFAADRSDALQQPVDSPTPAAQRPPDWSDFVPEIGPRDGDILITKRQWGAFYGTDLDLQLRRRGVTTIVLCGIATNFGVESTARDGWERNYEIIFAEDAMSAMDADSHQFAVTKIFPRIGRVRPTQQVLAELPK
ncbi:MAG TPA: hydrolase [Thermoanaerobaculia bacterium]